MPAKIYHHDLYGKREEKYEYLRNNSVSTTNWTELQPDEKYHFFVPKNFEDQVEWEKGVKVSELFEVTSSGVTTGNDAKFVSFDRFSKSTNQKYEYKYLDFRFIDYTPKELGRARFDVMKNYLNSSNISLNLMKTNYDLENYSRVCICTGIVDKNFYGFQSYTLPLYIYSDAEKSEGDIFEEMPCKAFENVEFGETPRQATPATPQEGNFPRPNFRPEIIAQIELSLSMKLDWESDVGVSLVFPLANSEQASHAPAKFSATDLLDYIYAVLHSPSYREKYKEFLKIDFPRIPFDVGRQRFWSLVEIGSKLRKLHLMEDISMDKLTVGYPVTGDNVVESLRFEVRNTPSELRSATPQEENFGSVWINKTQYFENVPETAFNFYIGGYQPAQKWLKDRKGRELSFDDILHYQKIINVLEQTSQIQNQIDL